ncbi:MAG: hypothetical protein LBK47_03345 [Prevotellaceae bacterium]|jgi:hypothetical protein|nr:hypothetical protein [Prevotellaceae bacterium]
MLLCQLYSATLNARYFLLLFTLLCCYAAVAQPSRSEVDALLLQGESNLYVGDNLDGLPLPLGFKRSFANYSITVALSSVGDDSPTDHVRMATKFRFPGTEEELYFATEGVELIDFARMDFSRARLHLISEHHIKLTDHVKLIVGGRENSQNCFVEWDCTGFKSVNLGVQVVFDSTVFMPANGSSSLRCNTVIQASSLDDILLQISLPPFKLSYTQDFVYTLTELTLDMSTIGNAPNFTLPAEYSSTFEGQPELWRGIYAKKIVVQLPPMLSPNASKPLVVQGENVVVDDYGFSAVISGEISSPMMGTEEWKLSVGKVRLDFYQSRLRGGFLHGSMMFAALDKKQLGYSATISTKDNAPAYAFQVNLEDTMQFKLLSTLSLSLTNDSYISLSGTADGKELVAQAHLNGYATVGDAESKTSITGLRFEHLQLSSKAPYLQSGYFALDAKEPMSLGNLPINLSSVALGFTDRSAALGLKVSVALMGASDKNGVAAATGLTFKAKNERGWKFDGVDISSINLNVAYSAFTLKGLIEIFKKDPVYGTGFNGEILLTLAGLPAEVEAGCRFGEVGEASSRFNYWFARVGVPVKIPVGTGVMITQLSGAVYQKMSPHKDVVGLYLPDSKTAFGFRAGAKLATFVGEDVAGLGVDFEMQFNSNLGVRNISLNGSGAFFPGSTGSSSAAGMSSDQKFKLAQEQSEKASAQALTAPIGVSLRSSYNLETRTFDATLDAAVQLKPAIVGSGRAAIHSSPDKWYFYVGKPSVPLKVSVLNLASATSYFMLGNQMEPLPPLPGNVLSITGKMKRVSLTDPAFNAGTGVAFGASLNVSKGFDFSVVYAQLGIGAGFDVLLKTYPGVGCSNTGTLLGMNSWYAQGQAYAYLQGSMGVKFKRSRFDILNVAMAAVLEAKAPNPTWVSGNVSARYKILGGLVKGSASLDFEVGEECQMVAMGNPLGNISFIGDVKPSEDERQINVFAMPQVAFNVAIGEAFEVEGFSGVNKYRVLLDEVKLSGEKSGNVVGTGAVSGFEFNARKDVLALSTKALLPGEEQVTLTVAVRVEQWTNNRWSTLKNDDGTDMNERREVSFTTGSRPKSIPENCVTYSYPIPNQFNFYKSEYPEGYIALTNDFGYLFSAEDGGKKYQNKVRFTSGKNVVESSVSYRSSDNQVLIKIPSNLSLASVYKMQIVRKEVVENSVADRNVVRSEVALASSGDNEATMQQNTLTETIGGEGEDIIYSSAFRTSRYATFREKTAAAPTPTPMYAVHSDTKSSLLALDFNMDESYDEFEVNGMDVEKFSLIKAEGIGQENWIASYAGGKIYSVPEIKSNSIAILHRNISGMGLVPLKKSVYIDDLNSRLYLTDADLQRTTIDRREGKVRVAYFVPHFVQLDYNRARSYVANNFRDSNVPANLSHLLKGESLSDIFQDYYKVRLNYVLPGKNMVTSSYEYTIDYHIR